MNTQGHEQEQGKIKSSFFSQIQLNLLGSFILGGLAVRFFTKDEFVLGLICIITGSVWSLYRANIEVKKDFYDFNQWNYLSISIGMIIGIVIYCFNPLRFGSCSHIAYF